MEKLNVDVAIIGAGPVGAVTALRLAAEGLSIAVVDRAPLPPMTHPDFDGRAYAIAAGSRRVLDAADVWERLPFPACPILDIRVSDGRVGQPPSTFFLHFDSEEEGFGPFGWIVEARSLRIALNRSLQNHPNIIVFAPATVQVTRTKEFGRVAIADGPEIECRLIVGAEGRASSLRRDAGIRVTRFAYRQSAVICAIAHEYPHHNVALEHFLPNGPFAQLPLCSIPNAEHASAIVFTERNDLAERLMQMSADAFTRQVAQRMGGYLGNIRLVGRRWCHPLTALVAQRYWDTRLVLLGDAAHGIHPIAGQGFNLGLRDVEALTEILAEAAINGCDIGLDGTLARYQAARRMDNLVMLAATDMLDRLFSTDFPPLRLGRDLGLAAVNRMPRLKRFFVRHAMGL